MTLEYNICLCLALAHENVCCSYMAVKTVGAFLMFSSIVLHLFFFFETGSLHEHGLQLLLDWLASELQGSICLCHSSAGIAAVCHL